MTIDDYAHAVCFHCRKSWTQRRPRNRNKLFPAATIRVCPDCGRPLSGLGLAFRAPKRSNRRAWKQIEAAVRGGCRFWKDEGGK